MEDKLRKIADVGRRTEALLADETLQAALKAIELDLIDAFREAPITEAERYWALLNAHQEIIRRLGVAVSNGREAEREIERLRDDARRERTES